MAKLSLLVLLIFTVQCGAIEYYVKPTHSGNISCPPSQICLTINQYTDPSNNYLELNNTIFTFLPGKHVMERPMEFNNVKNITLQAMDDAYPQLIPTYILCTSDTILVPYIDKSYQRNDIIHLSLSCFCSTIQMNEVVNVTISGLIIGAAVNISGIIIENSIDINIQNNIISYNNDLVNNATSELGVFINGSTDITIESLQTRHVVFGVLMQEVNHVLVQKSSFQNSLYSGLYIFESNHIKLLNIVSNHSGWYEIMLFYTRYSSIDNVHVSLSGLVGVLIDKCTHTTMMNILSSMNNYNSIDVRFSTDTTMTNISSLDNPYNAFNILYSINTTMINILSSKNNQTGIFVAYSTDTTMMNISTTSNHYDGIMIAYSTGTTMMNMSSENNYNYGIDVLQSTHTTMTNISSMNNQDISIYVRISTYTIMMNILAMNNHNNGIIIGRSLHTTMINILTMNNHGDSNINIGFSIDTTMINISSSTNNNCSGITVEESSDTTLMNILSTNNHDSGIIIKYSTNTTMTNVSTIDNQMNGINLKNSTDTTMINISSTNNKYDGVYIMKSINITMIDISTINNQGGGTYIGQSTDITMVNISTTNNQYFGVNVESCTNMIMMNRLLLMDSVSNSIISLKSSTNIHILKTSIIVDRNIDHTAISFFDCTDILLEENVFSGIISDLQQVTTNVADIPAIITLYKTNLTLENCNFTHNMITSISATSSNITVKKNIIFESISAISGAGFILSRSTIIVSDQSNVLFHNNSASQYGGVFYIVTEEVPDTSILIGDLINNGAGSFITSGTQCFIQVKGTRSNTARLTFINNTAMEGGDVVYGGLIAAGYDGDWNCLLSFKNISNMTDQSSVRQITSAPSRVCLCHHDAIPDCLIVADPTPHTIYPGETLTVSAAVVGQDFGTVSGDVHAQIMYTTYNDIAVQFDQKRVRYDNGVCKNLKYTLNSSCDKCEAVLVLTPDGKKISKLMNVTDNQRLNQSWFILQSQSDYHALAFYYAKKLITVFEDHLFLSEQYTDVINSVIDKFFTLTPEHIRRLIDTNPYELKYIRNKLRFPQQIYIYPLYINIKFHPCPVGFTLTHSQCDCNQILQHMPSVECDIDNQTITRAGSVWVGVDDNETVAASQYCPFNYCKNESIRLTLNNNNSTGPDSQCNYKHSGILCGGCQSGLSLALGSEQCLHCSNAYITLILPFASAGILLVLFIKVFDFTVCHGAINGLIFYANIISANKHLYYNQSDINPITLFISWFNLDLGIEICFYDGLTAYARTWLQFIFPIYIWCIAGAIIFLANHSKRVAVISGNNGVPVLATLFLFSYAKLFNTIISVISYTTLYTTQGQRLVWTVDGNVEYLGPDHAPLFVFALVVLLFLWLPYTLILLLGKYLNKINCRLVTRYLLKLKPFLDANYAPFNDRHQYWFGIILVIKAIILLSSATIPSNSSHIIVYSVAIASLLLTFWGSMVFGNTKTMRFHTFFFVNLGVLNITKMFIFDSMVEMTIASQTLIGLVLIQFLGVCLVKIARFSSVKWTDQIICCRKKEMEDDWEPYMLAAVQRKEESESEDSHSSGSIESISTYPLV